jgi:hypothetical protein
MQQADIAAFYEAAARPHVGSEQGTAACAAATDRPPSEFARPVTEGQV